jgi:homogentisate 1,2-dioxygenase
MPIYHRLGQIPPKRHMVYGEAGALLPEQLIGNDSFSGLSSLLYHRRRPTPIVSLTEIKDLTRACEPQRRLTPRHFQTTRLPGVKSAISDRVPLLFNDDVAISYAHASGADDFFYRNGQADELVFVVEGDGVLESLMGDLPYRQGDYLVIPRGILHRYRFGSAVNRFLFIESVGSVRTPKRYRNEFGQLTEIAPFCERDIRRPETLPAHDKIGEYRLIVKHDDRLLQVVTDHHPFDVVGWDGFYYPWAFNIRDFEPRVGRFHLPPTVHQTFEGDGFVVCSFCPRPFDFDPRAIPAPYHHLNVRSDEVLFYVDGEFTSRTGISKGSITLHPDGLDHGPQPGRTEASIGKTRTDEFAVMVDAFRPLHVARQADAVEDPQYHRSWLEGT